MAWLPLGDALALWGGDQAWDEAQTCYRRAVQLDPKNGPAWFRLGVCLRRRYESSQAQPGDFQAAIDAWGKALQLDLDQPYSFYDWVREAEQAVRARGDEPIRLSVRPTGAEIAHRSKRCPLPTKTPATPTRTARSSATRTAWSRRKQPWFPARSAPASRPASTSFFAPVQRKTHWNTLPRVLRACTWPLRKENDFCGECVVPILDPPRLGLAKMGLLRYGHDAVANAQC
jgi:tetratricopeptide (TPR) repeat protein